MAIAKPMQNGEYAQHNERDKLSSACAAVSRELRCKSYWFCHPVQIILTFYLSFV